MQSNRCARVRKDSARSASTNSSARPGRHNHVGRLTRLAIAAAGSLSVAASMATSLPVEAAPSSSGGSSSSSPSAHYPTPMAKMTVPSTPLQLHGSALDPRFIASASNGPSSPARLGVSSASTIPPASTDSGPKGYVEGKSTKVPAQWDATHRVWLNPDGTYTMRIYSAPQNYRDASGAWQPIDGAIQRDADGSMHPTGLPVGLRFAASTNDPDLVRVSDGHGNTIHFGAPDGAQNGAAGSASGVEVRYDGVFSGVDLEYAPSTDGVKELIVLNSAAAAAAHSSFSFPMQLGRLHAAMRKDGGVDILDPAGAVVFTIPAGTMTDSDVDPQLGDGRRGAVAYSLSARGATTVITVTPDASWLADPARVYPVYVDPTFTNTTQWDAYVAAAYPTSYLGDYWDTAITPNRWVVNAGRDPSGASGVNRTYAFYALDPLVNNHTRIISGHWHGYTAWTYWAPGGTASSYIINPVSGYWNGGTITWNTQPACCLSGWITIASPTYTWDSVDMTTWVVNWANGSWGRNGIQLDGANEADSTQWRRFASVKNTDGSASYMQVDYESYTTSYSFNNSDWDSGTTSNAYRGPLPNTNATLQVNVTNNGTNAWPANGNYRLAYHVYDRNGNLILWDGTRTLMPTTVNPGQSVLLNASIGGLNPGSYTLQWDMVEENVTWFSQQGQATAAFRIFVASPPTDQSPASGALVAAAPTLTVNPVSGAALYRFDFGTDSSFGTTSASTGWQSSNSWTVPSTVLTNGTTYYWRAIAADGADVTSQYSSTFSVNYDSRRVNVTKALVNPPAGGIYAKGGLVTFQISLSNPGTFATGVSVSDSLPSGLIATGAQVLVNAAACSGSITCTASGQTVNVQGLTVPAATSSGPGSLVVQLSVVATGLDRQCATLQNAASATASYGTVTSSPVSFVVCNSGLGFEKWWSYAGRSVGPGVAAQVNAANGNLVVQQSDFSTIQLHGHLALGLRRTYNSEDMTAVTLPGALGKGWTFNISEAGDLGDAGAGPDGLSVPTVASPLDAVTTAPPVTLIDQDGTRHTFTANGISTPIDVTSVSSAPADLAAVVKDVASVLSLDTSSGYTHLCVDQMYTAPPGVHLGLWRFVETGAACTGISGSSHAVLGFATMRPDRLLSVFSWDGHLLDLRDGAGNEIKYTYANAPIAGGVLGNLLTISEPVSGRQFVFSYPTALEMDVVDPAGRIAKYTFDGSGLASHLTDVTTLAKDGSTVLSDWKYVYGGCGGGADQLCKVTDPDGHTSSFTYTSVYADGPGVVGPAHLASMTDRLGNTTNVNAYSNPDHMSVVEGAEMTTFQSIDALTGRVGEIDGGNQSGSATPHKTLYTWDASGSTCRTDGVVDNDLCKLQRVGGPSPTPDEVTSYTYGPSGELLDQRQTLGSGYLDTTYGYHTQYLLASGAVNCVDETVAGSGSITTGATTQCVAPFAGLSDTHTVYAVVDKTQSLTPRGNAAGTGYSPYLTSYKVDNSAAVAPGAPPSTVTTDICANPASPTSNTGSLCETDAPAFDGTHATVTRYTYYPADGERKTMTTPKAIAENLTGVYTYAYYPDTGVDATQTKDLSATTSQGGWLKAVVDPTGNFVAYAYDAAGNVARVWDRNATAIVTGGVGAFPGTATVPASSSYTETLHQATSVTTGSPWLFLRSKRDPSGNTTTYTVDADGNQTAIRPPRGNQAGLPTFDITQTFDNADELLTRQLPVEATAGNKTTNTWDMFGNLVAITDPNGNVRTFQYDSVNREVSAKWTRGPSGGSAPLACTTSTASDAPIPLNKVVCSTTTTWDNVDNKIQTQDGNHQNTNDTYDAVHRLISQVGPRVVGTSGTRTDTVYDADGHVTAICPPNLWASGATACPDGRYAQTRAYDVAGRLSSSSTYREQLDTSTSVATLTTSYTYDADGNPVSATDANGHVANSTYNILDRRTQQTTYRDSAQTILLTRTWTYDPAGNTTSVTQPATSTTSRITAYQFDLDNRVVQTVRGADNTSAASAGLVDASGSKNIRTGVVYDADGNVVARFDPRAYATSTTSPDASHMLRTDYDADGRATAQYVPRFSASVTDPTTNTTQATQCSTAAPTPVTGVPAYPAGVGLCVTKAQYDAASNITKVVLPTSNGADNRFVAYSYTDDRLVSTVDSPDPSAANARGQSTAVYDADGKPVTVTDLLAHSQSAAYFPDELVQSTTDALNHTTSFSYDANGNRTLVTDPAGIQTQTDYYADNLRKRVISAAQDTTGAVKSTTAYQYDNVGNVSTVYSPSAWQVHTGLAADADNQLGTPSTMAYTYDNLVSYSVDPVIAKTGQALQQRRTDYGYDLGGRKTSQHTYLVDANLNALAGGDAGTQSFAYYPDDRQSVQTGRNNETITTLYDPAGDRTSVQDSTGGGSTVTATYYLDSHPRSVDDGSKTTQYAYDGSGLVLTRAQANDGVLSTPNLTTAYAYNDAGFAASMQSTVVGSVPTTYTYDRDGRMVGEADPNGTAQAWAYNNDDTLSTHTVTTPTSTLASWSYSYNVDRQQTQQTFSGVAAATTTSAGLDTQQYAYGYDKAGRLSSFQIGSAAAQSITFDHDNNRLSYGGDSYAYNADNSIASFTPSGSVTTQSFTYYPFGGLHSDTCLNSTYDGFDRLVSSSTAGTCGSGANGAYTYDGLDRQRSHQEGGSAATPLHYDGLSSSVVVESPAAGDITYELAADGNRRAVAQATTLQYLDDDGFGNTTTVTGVGGSVACTARFDPFGNTRNAQGTTAASRNACNTGSTVNTFFYRGGRQDQTTGDYQFGSRIYDPAKSAFLTPDSYRAGDAGANVSVGTDPLTANRYSYVNGDPINLVDPDGHDPCRYEDCSGTYDISAQQARANSGDSGPCRFEDCGNQVSISSQQARIASYGRSTAAFYALPDAPKKEGCGFLGLGCTWVGHAAGAVAGAAVSVGKTALAVGAGIATGVACEAVTGVETAGLSSAGCIVAGFAVGGAVNGALNCSGSSELACAGTGALSGAVTGAVVVATGGTAAAAGVARTALSFAAAGAASSATEQAVTSGHVDVSNVAAAGILSGVTGGALRTLATGATGIGDLTSGEVRQIQGVVDSAGRPLNVVGSAARATRRGIGSDLPIGKGAGTRSDIDYLVPPGNAPYFRGLEGDLPSIDPGSGIIVGHPNPWIGPWIRFEPGAEPYYVPGEPQ